MVDGLRYQLLNLQSRVSKRAGFEEEHHAC